MACPLRACAFIAQARHATDGFLSLKASNNAAGAIHLQPFNFKLACEQIPELNTKFMTQFGTCDPGTGKNSEMANIIAQPEFAFRVAVWWFIKGSRQMLNEVCGDLRFDSDCGLGAFQMYGRCVLPLS